MRDTYLVFGQPLIEEPEIAEVVDSLRRRWPGTGPKVKAFEKQIAAYTGAAHAICLSSCTAGLELSLIVAGIRPGDEVITSTLTFPATANAILHTGAVPVLVDVDPHTQNMDPALVAAAVTKRTRALIPVHMAGRPCDMDGLRAIADEHGLVVIDDAAHALGASYHGRKIGTLADLTCFSFYATKNIVTGEGGAVTTQREGWAHDLETLALHGLSAGAWERYASGGNPLYVAVKPGYKANMTDMQAALGIHQMPRIEDYQARRERLWMMYDERLAEVPGIHLPAPPEPDTEHARHLYTVMIESDAPGARDRVRAAMHEQRIGTGVHFVALHLHPYYAETLGLHPDAFPNADWISHHTLSLPLSPALEERDIDDVVAALRASLA
jgi:dTDP-4-amino-4,6-dideoxygalactose transaminase